MINLKRTKYFKRCAKGAVVVEFAVSLLLFILICVVATDISLAIFARGKVQKAAHAGAEFAATLGYEPNGIRAAAVSSVSGSVLTITTSDVTVSSLRCFCSNTGVLVDIRAADLVTRMCPFNSADSATFCGLTSFSPQSPIAPLPMVTVTVREVYKPLIPFYWGPWLNSSGELVLTHSITARTF